MIAREPAKIKESQQVLKFRGWWISFKLLLLFFRHQIYIYIFFFNAFLRKGALIILRWVQNNFHLSPGANHRSAQVLLLLVIPGHLIFLYTIHLMKSGHTTLTPIFMSVYLAAAMLQVSALRLFFFNLRRCFSARQFRNTWAFYCHSSSLDLNVFALNLFITPVDLKAAQGRVF